MTCRYAVKIRQPLVAWITESSDVSWRSCARRRARVSHRSSIVRSRPATAVRRASIVPSRPATAVRRSLSSAIRRLRSVNNAQRFNSVRDTPSVVDRGSPDASAPADAGIEESADDAPPRSSATRQTGPASATRAESVAFVLCIERNAMRPQALLLIESIRAFAGAHRNAQIWAVAPRPRLGVDDETRARLGALDATYVQEPLNLACPDYGSANRVYAAAWVARRATATTLVILDSDTLILDEPELLGPQTDVAA
jgi:hypothetical protein